MFPTEHKTIATAGYNGHMHYFSPKGWVDPGKNDLLLVYCIHFYSQQNALKNTNNGIKNKGESMYRGLKGLQ